MIPLHITARELYRVHEAGGIVYLGVTSEASCALPGRALGHIGKGAFSVVGGVGSPDWMKLLPGGAP